MTGMFRRVGGAGHRSRAGCCGDRARLSRKGKGLLSNDGGGEGKFSGGKEFRPTVGGESDVGRRDNRNKVILSCLHSALSFVGPMHEGGDALEGKRGLLAAKEGGELIFRRKSRCLRQGK